ncbi:MAG: hypothetical protein QG620_748 [Patescibacteria group bacterium]|nr:hypothetical protein [Patescibacteria group bacterium]
MAKYFFWGVIAAAGALVAESLFFAIANSATAYLPQYETLLACAVPATFEEFLKSLFIKKTREENAATDKTYFTKIALIGLGFALIELLLNAFNKPLPELFFYYALGGIFIHLATALLTGFILLNTFHIRKFPTFISAIPAIILHLAYNLLIVYFF